MSETGLKNEAFRPTFEFLGGWNQRLLKIISEGGLSEKTKQEKEVLQKDVAASILELTTGKKDRAIHVLTHFIDSCEPVSNPLRRNQDVAGDQIAFQAIDDALQAIDALEPLDPKGARTRRRDINKLKGQNTPWYMR